MPRRNVCETLCCFSTAQSISLILEKITIGIIDNVLYVQRLDVERRKIKKGKDADHVCVCVCVTFWWATWQVTGNMEGHTRSTVLLQVCRKLGQETQTGEQLWHTIRRLPHNLRCAAAYYFFLKKTPTTKNVRGSTRQKALEVSVGQCALLQGRDGPAFHCCKPVYKPRLCLSYTIK